ncbi:MAG: T9SS type A sorting domain-containing protein, partial [Bacteroidetes bacterium]|nr:T9SS type A sorting domain-containing protein [Bacteroidota bacterium]
NPLSLSSGNPTVIPYTLKSAAPLRIIITDLLGRTVRVLEDAVKSGGQHTALWDGRGDNGDFVSPGIYFVRFYSFGTVMTLRISVIR